MEKPEDPIPQRLRVLPSRLINQVAMSANRLVDQALAETGSRRYHYALLAALEEFGPASQAALGRRTGIDRSDIVATVNELAEREFVERNPDPGDRRRNIITVTPAGVQWLKELDRLLSQAQDELLTPLSSAEREQLIALLTRIADRHSASH
ncbi:Transcriptional regulator, MarR family [[Actinomadura] parvosata subsp. kistnae]|uniref:MarR family transcriptional regulator n=1 Tax=[Actinomadura] parvosata subsp. kistnae TaxID=1909395 RepID=A0A1V0AL35_9ACTN|nr:MarR family transcriptional regulator [Nonomuraea sp. ATCC 55076]AQZ70869.1 MarR family transcriptional regulator [Nonomuraea sp. ATCC 55076]SPL97321.1 Transcriptional regulator, MarR family [Actinomadura parvosata subsp. kistnae]